MLKGIENFGAIDAESDDRLIEYFYESQLLEELFSNQKAIVIGRKGTGKTAIYKYMNNKKGEFCSPLLFRDYPWRIHDKFKNEFVSPRESYVSSWTFYLYIEIIKKLIFNIEHINDKREKRTVKKLANWLKRNWGSYKFDHKETLNIQRRKWNFVFAPAVMGNALGSVSKDVSHTEGNYGETLAEYNKKLKNIISKILMKYDGEILLLFDELDLAYSDGNEEYKNRVIGLLLAAFSLRNQISEKVKVYIFLRSDIFNNLQFQDKNKIKDNIVQFLDWESNTEGSELSLRSMISNRIKKNIDSDSDQFEINWSMVFENNKIGKNQNKWNFIVDRTFCRPRDIIKFMNLSLDEAKSRLLMQPNGIDKITNDDIHNVRQKYSVYLFQELQDEVNGKYENFDNYLEILRNIHKVTFSMDDFKLSYDKLKERFQDSETPEIIMERLYEFSTIGFYKPGGGGYGGSEYRFQYTSDYQAFNPTATKFKVHMGFKEYLELVE